MGYVANQRSLLITNITMLVTAELSIALRFWVRSKLRSKLGAEDWCALAAGITFLINNVTMCWAISKNYMDVDPYTMDPAHLEISLKLVFAGVFLMSIILTFCRFSVLFLYNRLFGVYVAFRKILIIYGVVSFMWPLTIWFGTAFRCKPELFIGTETINAVLDIFLVILPIRKIKTIQLPVKDRIGLAIVFLLGGFVGLTSVLRIVFTYNPSKLGAVVDSVFWLELQLGTAIICCCLPTLRPLLPSKRLFAPISSSIRGLFGSRQSNSASSGSRSRSNMSGQGLGKRERQMKKDRVYVDTTVSTKNEDEIALTGVDTDH